MSEAEAREKRIASAVVFMRRLEAGVLGAANGTCSSCERPAYLLTPTGHWCGRHMPESDVSKYVNGKIYVRACGRDGCRNWVTLANALRYEVAACKEHFVEIVTPRGSRRRRAIPATVPMECDRCSREFFGRGGRDEVCSSCSDLEIGIDPYWMS